MAAQSAAASRGKRSGSKRVIVLLCNESILGGFGKVTNLLLGGLVLRNQPPIRGLSVM